MEPHLSCPQGSSTTHGILAQCEDLNLTGHFDSALKLLEPLLEDASIPVETLVEVHRTAARILAARGFSQAAEECSKRACTISAGNLNQQQLLSRDVHQAYVIIVVCGGILEDDIPLVRAQSFLNQLRDLDRYDRDAVSILNFE